MTDHDLALLRTLLRSLTTQLAQTGTWTADEWFELADTLDRAVKRARAEGNRLSGVKARTERIG